MLPIAGTRRLLLSGDRLRAWEPARRAGYLRGEQARRCGVCNRGHGLLHENVEYQNYYAGKSATPQIAVHRQTKFIFGRLSYADPGKKANLSDVTTPPDLALGQAYLCPFAARNAAQRFSCAAEIRFSASGLK